MSRVGRALGSFLESVVGFLVMIVLAVVAFYLTVFVVRTGGALAGQAPSGNFVVLSAALLVVAAILAGGLSPASALGTSSRQYAASGTTGADASGRAATVGSATGSRLWGAPPGEPMRAEAAGHRDAEGIEECDAFVAPPADAPTAEGPSLARFQLYRDSADEWRWRLVHRNGNVIATSGEGYSSDRSARRGLRSVLKNAPDAEVEWEP
ncbi:HVO_2922 family protein [Halorarum halobium]|uniref:HVO_2922 family protein n=1 Tax=Halorarum halobium TaxID=3075121 RepID=UPI0028AA534E|nr:HVO_2922 family protein [Halobaculum sp. XH14]